MRASRIAVAGLATCLLVLSGCGSEEQRPPPPWDGSFTPLEEQGDWQDTGPYAACKVLPVDQDPCQQSVESFDLTACPVETLGRVKREGVYRAAIRWEYTSVVTSRRVIEDGYMGLQFGPDGEPVQVLGQEPSATRFDASTFLLSSVEYEPWGDEITYTVTGCQATSRSITGCISACLRTSQQSPPRQWLTGTFRAARMGQGLLERQSLGMDRVSESFVELGKPVDVYVAKDHAYVVSLNRFGEAGGLTVFDVSDRRNPIFKASISIPGDNDWNGVWAKGDALYVASDVSGVIVFDISNPGQPEQVRRVPGGSALNVHTVLVDGDRLYAMSPAPNRETLIFDVSTPLEPRLLTRHVNRAWGGYPHDAFAHGGRLYVSHTRGGYQVLDVSDPAQVRELGGYRFPGNYSHHSAVGVIGGHTVAFEGGERLGAHVRALKVDDPANIVKMGEFKLNDLASVHNMLLKDERLYVAWYHEGVQVLNVSNPTQPRKLAWYHTYRDSDPDRRDGMFEGAIGIRVPGDGHVYVVDTARGLLILTEP
jgi:hypothetical protein